MALRIGESVLRGEIYNVRRNSVHGYILLEGLDHPLMLELTGNGADDMRGKALRFERRDASVPGKDAKEYSLHPHQIGPVGLATTQRPIKDLPCSVEEFMHRANLGEAPPTEWKPALTLEWYSQNGRVLIELIDPVMEFFDPDHPVESGDPVPNPDLPSEEEDQEEYARRKDSYPQATLIEMNGDVYEVSEIKPPDDDKEQGDEFDPGFGFENEELQADLDDESRAIERLLAEGKDLDDDAVQEEVMRLADKLLTEFPGEPVGTLFQPKRLPRPEDVSEEEAEDLVKGLLAELALYAVAIHVCEHYTWLDTYRFILEEIAWEQRVTPALRGSGWTQNFMTSESCPLCLQQADRDYEEYEKRRKEEEGEEQ